MSGQDELRRALREAAVDDAASLGRLISELNRIGITGTTRHHELLSDALDGVLMRAGRVLEVLDVDGAPLRFKVAANLGYGVAFGPSGIWAEAEIAETVLGNFVVREKVRSTGEHGGSLELAFAAFETLEPLRQRCAAHGRSPVIHVGTLYEATENALRFVVEDPLAVSLVRLDWRRANER